MCSGSETGSYLRLIDSCITQAVLRASKARKELRTELELILAAPEPIVWEAPSLSEQRSKEQRREERSAMGKRKRSKSGGEDGGDKA